jgi:hypothetical protein
MHSAARGATPVTPRALTSPKFPLHHPPPRAGKPAVAADALV